MWRPMEHRDIPQVFEMANQVHELYEEPAIFTERQSLCPEGCFVLDSIGYAISHSYWLDSPPLNTLIHQLPLSNCWYIHDLVILPEYRKRGYATSILHILTNLAKQQGKKYLTLTTVNHTEAFWTRRGFRPYPSISCPTYGPSVFMVKSL